MEISIPNASPKQPLQMAPLPLLFSSMWNSPDSCCSPWPKLRGADVAAGRKDAGRGRRSPGWARDAGGALQDSPSQSPPRLAPCPFPHAGAAAEAYQRREVLKFFGFAGFPASFPTCFPANQGDPLTPCSTQRVAHHADYLSKSIPPALEPCPRRKLPRNRLTEERKEENRSRSCRSFFQQICSTFRRSLTTKSFLLTRRSNPARTPLSTSPQSAAKDPAIIADSETYQQNHRLSIHSSCQTLSI